jgi:hypothetical protein
MTSGTSGTNPPVVTSTGTPSPMVMRSTVTPTSNYHDYKPVLRHDFFRSCAYCTMSEAEAQAMRFTIDHYEPRALYPQLVNEYSNLMYCCDECNSRKGDLCPPDTARAAGVRFFRPDEDIYPDHFELTGIRLKHKTAIGDFSIDGLDLNRAMLRKLRELRQRLEQCDAWVAGGVIALKSFPIDQLPQSIKGAASRAIRQAVRAADDLANDIDDILQEYATSPLLDVEEDTAEHVEERKKKLKELKALHKGNWRAPRDRKGRSS